MTTRAPAIEILEFAASLRESARAAELPSHAVQALDRASALVRGSWRTSPPAPLTWVDDLGLRTFDSPRIAFTATCGALGVEVPPSSSPDLAAYDLAGLIDAPELLCALLSCLVDDLGAWHEATCVAAGVAKQLAAGRSLVHDGFDSYRALVRCGNLLAVAERPECIAMYERAQGCAVSPAWHAMASFRIAVAQLKRLDASPHAVDAAIECAALDMATIAAPGDRQLALGILSNLRALVRVRAREMRLAREEIAAAWELLADTRLTPSEYSSRMLDVARNQVLSNHAVVVGMSDGWHAALPMFEQNVDGAAHASAPVQMEAHGMLAYANWRLGNTAEARSLLLRADEFASLEPLPQQRAELWKLLAVVEHEMGDEAASDYWRNRLALTSRGSGAH